MKRPTIIDVARAARVSKSTVSLVLNNSALVVPDKRQAVRKAMAELGYVYNRAAAKMRSDKVGLIGLVVNNLRNPFFTEFAVSAQEALAERGYATVIANSNEDAATQQMVVASMIEHGVSALMISAADGDAESAGMIERAGIPTLSVLRRLEGGGFPFVSFDFAEGSRLALRHLIDSGARRIAFVGGLPERPITRERMAAFGARMGPGQPVALAIHGIATRAFGRNAVPELLHNGIDAVLCFNDLTALGVMDGLREAGKRPGRDMAVMGFDDIAEAAEASPPLSSVRVEIAAFGRRTSELVLDWMEGGEPLPGELRLPVSLAERETTARR